MLTNSQPPGTFKFRSLMAAEIPAVSWQSMEKFKVASLADTHAECSRGQQLQLTHVNKSRTHLNTESLAMTAGGSAFNSSNI